MCTLWCKCIIIIEAGSYHLKHHLCCPADDLVPLYVSASSCSCCVQHFDDSAKLMVAWAEIVASSELTPLLYQTFVNIAQSAAGQYTSHKNSAQYESIMMNKIMGCDGTPSNVRMEIHFNESFDAVAIHRPLLLA